MKQSIVDQKSAVRSGVSRALDPIVAAQEIFESLSQPNISLAVVFCSTDYDLDILAQALKKSFGDTLLIGCTTAGEISQDGYENGTITGFSLAAPDFVVECASMKDLASFGIQQGHDVAQNLVNAHTRAGCEPDSRNTFAFLMIDGMSFKEEMVASAVSSGLGDIPLFGGSAGNNEWGKPGNTHVFYDGRFQNNAAVVSVIHTNHPFVVFKTENYVASDTKFVITEANPAIRRVLEINGEAAGLEYLELVGPEPGQTSEMTSATHPVGVAFGDEFYIRSIRTIHPDQSIEFACALDRGAILSLATRTDFLSNLIQQFEEIHSEIGAPEIVLACDCLLRMFEAKREGVIAKTERIFNENHVVGFRTYGEQFNSMHINQTLTGVAIGAQKQT